MVIVHINVHTLSVFALQYDSMSGLVLPGKRTFNNMNKDFLEKRKVGLNAFLQVIYMCYHKNKNICMHAEYVCNHVGTQGAHKDCLCITVGYSIPLGSCV